MKGFTDNAHNKSYEFCGEGFETLKTIYQVSSSI